MNCVVCDGAEFEDGPFETIICRHCNLVRKQSLEVDMSTFAGANETSIGQLYASRFAVIQPYLKPNIDILEIGCRAGRFLSMISAFMPVIRLHGLDPSHEAIAAAAHLGSMQAAPLETATLEEYDLILSTGVFYRHPDPVSMIAKMSDALRPEGVLYLELGMITDNAGDMRTAGAEWYAHVHPILYWYHTEHIKALFNRQGLTLHDEGWLPGQHTTPDTFWWGIFCK